MGSHVDNLNLTDSAVARTIQRVISWPASPSPHTIAPNVGATAASYYLGLKWIKSIQDVRGISSEAHYKRLRASAIFRMKSYMTIVRTSCIVYENYTMPDGPSWVYPFLPMAGPEMKINYTLPDGLISNSSSTTMQWHLPPYGSTKLSNGSYTDYYPSTFLDIQIPHNGSAMFSGLWTCSVDARWVYGDNVGTGFNDHIKSSYSMYGALPNEFSDFPFTKNTRPLHGPARMTADWLRTLTPFLGPDYTTLAALLDPLTMWYERPVIFTDEVQSIVATVIADGMSRIGYSLNGGGYTIPAYATKVIDRYDIDDSNFHDEVYKGKAVLGPPQRDGPFNDTYDYNNSTKLTWKVSIGGYYYRADGAAKQFSLAVLLLHAAIALAYFAQRLWTRDRDSSDAWNSVPELLALAQNSQPTSQLANTSAGIHRGQTMARHARIRCVERSADEKAAATDEYLGEQLQLLFDDHQEDERKSEMLVVDGRYGQL